VHEQQLIRAVGTAQKRGGMREGGKIK